MSQHTKEFTCRQKETIYKWQNGRCADCKKKLKGYWRENKSIVFNTWNPTEEKKIFCVERAETHHIVPLHLGGIHRIRNGMWLCLLCHYKQHRLINADTKKFISRMRSEYPDCFSEQSQKDEIDLSCDLGSVRLG